MSLRVGCFFVCLFLSPQKVEFCMAEGGTAGIPHHSLRIVNMHQSK